MEAFQEAVEEDEEGPDASRVDQDEGTQPQERRVHLQAAAARVAARSRHARRIHDGRAACCCTHTAPSCQCPSRLIGS